MTNEKKKEDYLGSFDFERGKLLFIRPSTPFKFRIFWSTVNRKKLESYANFAVSKM